MRKLLKLLTVMTAFVMLAASAFAARNMNPMPAINGQYPEITPTSVVNLEADIVVIGGGLAGMSAGLTAAEAGAKVIIFEKLPSIGGAGVYPEGSLGIGTKIQASENKNQHTVMEALGKITEFHHYRLNVPVMHNLLKNSGATIDWVQSEGVGFKGLRTVYPPEKTLWTWHIYQKNGASITKNFYKKILAMGGEIYMETPVKKILINDKGEVTGVEAIDIVTGIKYVVNAKGGVIVSTGGFANNRDMIEEYITDVNQPNMVPVKLRGPLVDGREGDGIRMGMEIGAATASMQTIAGNSPYVDQWPPIHQFNGADYQKQARTSLSQPFLWVNKEGERFFNESVGSSFTDVYNAMTMNGGVMYSIWDDKMRQKMIKEGPVTPFNAIVVPGQPMTALDQAIEIGLKEGWIIKGKNLDDLAKQLGMEPATLKATVQKVNEYTKNGVDPDFGRKKEHLFTFDSKGPYYAVKGIRAYFLTLGGLKMNENMQVYNTENKIIPGLYVAGQDMGGLYDSTYDLLLEGSASGLALTSGRMAAKHIVDTRLNLKKK